MIFHYQKIAVFTDEKRGYTGNPSACMFFKIPPSEEEMQKMASKTKQPATTFLWQVEGEENHFHVRWYAVDDERNICPEGWHVPSADQWDALTGYLIDTYDDVYAFNVANALKSCRQVGSPLGGECDTDEHPRWDGYDTEYGIDLVGFSAFAAGSRNFFGNYFNLGNFAFFWTSSENPADDDVLYRRMLRYSGEVQALSSSENSGFSVRCVRVDEQ